MATKVEAGMETEANGNGVPEMAKKNEKGKAKRSLGRLWQTVCQIGRDDPRRIIHALKVGVSLTLVSLLYLMEPLFKSVGTSAIWAIMTVVVVLEFSAGATLYKGLNRGLGTCLAGSLAFLIEIISAESGKVFHAVFIGAAVFLIGTATTYMRFIPSVKKNYDYGVVVFLLTFNLITVSSYRVQDVLKIAEDRFYAIAIGCGICLLMSLVIFPIWSGEDLHNSTVSKLEGLAKSIEACVNEYFNDSEEKQNGKSSSDDAIYKGYKAVLDSKSTDENLALYASWEPRRSRRYRNPWQQYVKVGAVLRQFGYSVVALHGCLQTEIQTPPSIRVLFKGACIQLAREVSKALTELAESIRNRRHFSTEILSGHLQEALQDLNNALKSQPRLFLGSNSNQAKNMLALSARLNKESKDIQGASSSSIKRDLSGPLGRKSKKVNELHGRESGRKVLRTQLSKVAITSLEFSEALPFASFVALLVEIVAKLDNVIEEVEELGTMARFQEYNPEDIEEILVKSETPPVDVTQNQLPSHASD